MAPLKKFLDWLRDPNQIKAQRKKNREFLDQSHSDMVDFRLGLHSSHPYRSVRTSRKDVEDTSDGR